MDAWNDFRLIQKKDTKECINFSVYLNFKYVLSYRINNGSSNLHSHLDACQLNKTSNNTNAGNIRNAVFKVTFSEVEKKDITKACVVYSALYLRLFLQFWDKVSRGF